MWTIVPTASLNLSRHTARRVIAHGTYRGNVRNGGGSRTSTWMNSQSRKWLASSTFMAESPEGDSEKYRGSGRETPLEPFHSSPGLSAFRYSDGRVSPSTT